MDEVKLGGMNITFKQLSSGNVHEIYIYDDIEEHGRFNYVTWEYEKSETSAKHFKELLEAIPDTDTIMCYINSNGGSVKEGVSIYNQLMRHKAQKTCYVDGFANSVASLIVQAFDKRIMCLGTSMLIHDMWMYIAGNATQLRKAADDLDDLMKSNRQIYLNRAEGKITEDVLQELMAQEKYLTPDECIEYGLADEIYTGKTADTSLMSQMIKDGHQMLEAQKNIMQGIRQELNLMANPKRTVEKTKYEKAADFFSRLF